MLAIFRTSVLLLAAFACLQADDASRLFSQGKKAEKKGNFEQAYVLYTQAAVLSPRKPEYWLNAQRLRAKADLQPVFSPLLPGTNLDSGQKPMSPEMASWGTPQPPIRLQPRDKQESLTLNGRTRELWERIAALFRLTVVFDSDFQETGESSRIVLEDADFLTAARIVEAATGTFLVPIGRTVALVANDTAAKRRDLEPTVSVLIPVPTTVNNEELQQLVQTVRQMTDARRLFVDSQRNVIVLNDSTSKVGPAQHLLEQMIAHRGQIGVEIELLQVSRTRFLTYGLSLPTTFPITFLGNLLGHKAAVPANALGIGSGMSLFALGIQSAQAFARMTEGETEIMIRSMLRSVDGQKAEMKIGDRFPIATSFFSAIDDEGVGQSVAPPTVQYEDLGLVIAVTPRMHGDDEVTLEIEADFKLLTGFAVNSLPIIANRTFKSSARFRFGEVAILSGLMTSQESRAIQGLFGLSQIPFLGHLFRQNTREDASAETLLLIKPVLLAAPPSSGSVPAFAVGSEGRPRIPLW